MPILGSVASQNTKTFLFAPSGAYDSIATATVSNGTTQTITFSSIPATYTHLQLRYIVRTNRSDDYSDAIGIRFNSDTGSNYYRHHFGTEGSWTSSGGSSGSDAQYHIQAATALSLANTFGNGVIDIFDYANTIKQKTTRSLGGNNNNTSNQDWLLFASSLWRNTSAINTIDLKVNYGTYYAVGSKIALYGIKGA